MGSPSTFQVAPFVADVTPRLGDTLVFGLDADSTVAVIEHPLLAKGVVLRDAGGTYVLCALDWCTLGTDAYEAIDGHLNTVRADLADWEPVIRDTAFD